MSSVAEVVMLLGAVQGLVLALAVIGRRQARALTANRVLALFLVLVSVRLGDVLLHAAGVLRRGPDATLPLPFTFPPLLWIYVRALTEPGFRVRPALALHAIPAAALAALLALGAWPVTPAHLPDPIDVGWALQAAAYVGAILVRLRSNRRRVEQLGSSDRMRLDWLRDLTLTFAAILGLMLVYLGSFAIGHPLPPGSHRVLYAGVAVVVYAWGYLGLRHSEVLAVPPDLVPPEPPPPRDAPGEEDSRGIRERVLRAMKDDRPYLDPELSLRDLAARLDVPAYLLSQVINRELGQNFFRFVNEYRVAEAKRLLAGTDKVLAVALESGFSAKSSFNRVFREIAGVTPSEYRRTLVPEARSEGSRS